MVTFLYGCASRVFEIDKAEGGISEEIQGIKDLLDKDIKNVNVVLVHGMGIHDQKIEMSENGINFNYQNSIAAALNFIEADGDDAYHSEKLFLRDSSIVGGNLIYRKFINKTNGQTLSFFAISWDEITRDIQKTLFELDDDFYETRGSKNREKGRAKINKELKKFINSSFADPAIYLGTFAPEIQYLVAQGISKIDGIISSHKSNSEKIVLISDSMGSSVVFDTVMKASELKTEFLKEFKKPVEKFAGITTLIFMNANQLPLLELGRLKAPKPNESLEEWLDNYPCHKPSDNKAMDKSRSSVLDAMTAFVNTRSSYLGSLKNENKNLFKHKLQIVAFTDPNDPLSYYLSKRFKAHCEVDKDMKIVNILLTNATNYLNIFANPVKAHSSGFKVNPKAIEIVATGNH